MLEDLKIQRECLVNLFWDHKSVISIAHNSVQCDITNKLRLNGILQRKVGNWWIITAYIPSGYSLVDVLTEDLPTKMIQPTYYKFGWFISLHPFKGML